MHLCDCCHDQTLLPREYRLPEFHEQQRPEPGPWRVCDRCAPLIEARDPTGLLQRIWPAARRNHLYAGWPDYQLRSHYQTMLASFCAYWEWLSTPAFPVTIGRIPGLRQMLLDSLSVTFRKAGETSYVPTVEAFSRASWVLWRPDLWDGCQQGKEVFLGLPLSPLQASAGAQVWLHEDGHPVMNSPRLLAHHELAPDCRFLGAYLIPIKFNGLPCYLHGLIYRRPEGSSPDGSATVEISAFAPHFCADLVTESFSNFAAGLAFMDLEWVGRERHQHPAHLQRHALKTQKELPEVYVIRLRRAFQETTAPREGPGHTWDCSWMVSGYWQRRLCKDGYRPVYVKGHVKGNLNAPLRTPRETIYHVAR